MMFTASGTKAELVHEAEKQNDPNALSPPTTLSSARSFQELRELYPDRFDTSKRGILAWRDFAKSKAHKLSPREWYKRDRRKSNLKELPRLITGSISLMPELEDLDQMPNSSWAEDESSIHLLAPEFQEKPPEFTEDFLLLNVGGISYRIRPTSIYYRMKKSRLGKFVLMNKEQRRQWCDGYVEYTDEWFFERSAKLFEPVFKYYVTGALHRPMDVCLQEFLDELQFWCIPELTISSCCLPKRLEEEHKEDEEEEDDFKDIWEGERRKRMWNFCEGSGQTGSTIFSFISIGFVLVSITGLIMSSIPELQVLVEYPNPLNISHPIFEMEPHMYFTYLEYICITWFTLEFVARYLIAPKKIAFLKEVLNIVDILAIGPFYLELGLQLGGVDTAQLKDLKGALLVIRILRVLRVVRILKLGRYSAGMRTFALTMKSSAKQLGMMFIVLATGIVFFSTMVYFMEKDEPNTPFTSIPAGFWWCIVTMTTVGYGDVVPATLIGKLIGSGAILCGVLVLALPITIIVDNFMKVSGK